MRLAQARRGSNSADAPANQHDATQLIRRPSGVSTTNFCTNTEDSTSGTWSDCDLWPAVFITPETSMPTTPISLDNYLLPVPTIKVCAALSENGKILGISCANAALSKSRPPAPHVPLPLQPLPLQLEVVHYEFIDRFPFPSLRYNMILLRDFIDVEDFLNDIFGSESFTIEGGGPTWNPSAWIISESFRAKWGYLFLEGSAA